MLVVLTEIFGSVLTVRVTGNTLGRGLKPPEVTVMVPW